MRSDVYTVLLTFIAIVLFGYFGWLRMRNLEKDYESANRRILLVADLLKTGQVFQVSAPVKEKKVDIPFREVEFYSMQMVSGVPMFSLGGTAVYQLGDLSPYGKVMMIAADAFLALSVKGPCYVGQYNSQNLIESDRPQGYNVFRKKEE